jgi:3-isopropylmalate dehydratase small subunit
MCAIRSIFIRIVANNSDKKGLICHIQIRQKRSYLYKYNSDKKGLDCLINIQKKEVIITADKSGGAIIDFLFNYLNYSIFQAKSQVTNVISFL